MKRDIPWLPLTPEIMGWSLTALWLASRLPGCVSSFTVLPDYYLVSQFPVCFLPGVLVIRFVETSEDATIQYGSQSAEFPMKAYTAQYLLTYIIVTSYSNCLHQ